MPDETFETKRGDLGEAKRVEGGAVSVLAAAPGTLSFTALDQRQDAISTERRSGGPELEEEGGDSNPEVAPTGCAPAPEE
ncbi:MAG TPA: hypothetical protein VMV46_04385 [Thermoanaerobaculia bacterium]|nr:hypothetical protein [Thermoanaerobaculia bacterium]